MARKTFSFAVEGDSLFPLDMLRYDAAHPASNFTPDAVEMLTLSLDQEYRSAYRLENGEYPKFRVWLRCYDRPPTEARWASFGWRVIQVEKGW